MTNPDSNKSKEIQTLIQNMETFNEVTEQLQISYDELQGRVKKLDLELSDKNDELEKFISKKTNTPIICRVETLEKIDKINIKRIALTKKQEIQKCI